MQLWTGLTPLVIDIKPTSHFGMQAIELRKSCGPVERSSGLDELHIRRLARLQLAQSQGSSPVLTRITAPSNQEQAVYQHQLLVTNLAGATTDLHCICLFSAVHSLLDGAMTKSSMHETCREDSMICAHIIECRCLYHLITNAHPKGPKNPTRVCG